MGVHWPTLYYIKQLTFAVFVFFTSFCSTASCQVFQIDAEKYKLGTTSVVQNLSAMDKKKLYRNVKHKKQCDIQTFFVVDRFVPFLGMSVLELIWL